MKRFVRYLVCSLLCFVMLLGLSAVCAAQAEGLEVHFMDIARNDGILIRCGGEDVFIDSGGYKQGREANAYMEALGITKLKYYIGTHAHNDHIGGAPLIIAKFQPDAVIQPDERVHQAILKNVRSTAEKQIVPNTSYQTVYPGDVVRVGDATLTVLGPMYIRDVGPQSGSENNNSLVMMLSYGDVDILLSGDATNAEFREIEAANPGCLKADVYKNAHHNQATYKDVFPLIAPEYVIFSTARGYMPASSYLETIHQFSSKMLLTSPNHSSHIILRSDGNTYSFETAKNAESIYLKQTELNIYEGKTGYVNAKLVPSGRFRALTYTTSNPEVATVSYTGKVTGVSAGTATIRVTDGGGLYAECTVNVSPATLTLRKTAMTVKQHSRAAASWKIQPSGSKAVITWASRDESIATVDERGRVTGVYPGETVVTATMPSGQVCELAVTVTPIKVSSVSIRPSSVTMTIGDSRTVTAKISPSKATWPEVTWSSADPSIATIDQQGNLHAVGVGKTTISATTIEGKTRTARITVKPVYVKKILVTGETANLVGGVPGRNQVQLKYGIEPANATIKDVKWTTSNKRVAVVDENGLVTGLKAGTVTITAKATDGSGRYGRIKITFAANEMKRKVVRVEGEMVVQASRIRYYSTDKLEVTMNWINRSGQPQLTPEYGMLVLVTPDGTQIPLVPSVTSRQSTLKHRYTRTLTYRVPLATNPRLYNLDLTRCDAIIVPYGR